jgi:threonine/homoserine/homoserine lactone efflux protein
MIVEPTTLGLFAAASLALNLTPGPDMLYAIGRSTSQGTRAGLAAAAGNFGGTLIHTAALVLGLSALLAASAEAMSAVRLVGALLLVAIGLRMLLSAPSSTSTDSTPPPRPAPLARVAAESLLIHTLNPKTAVFFLAFVPQFVTHGGASAASQSAVLGLWFAAQAACVLAVISFVAGWAGARLRPHARLTDTLRRGVGLALAASGMRLAMAGR